MFQPGMGKYWLAAGGLGALAALCNPQMRRATGEFVNEFIWMWLQQQQAQSALLPPPQALSLPAPATTPRESLLDDYGAISAYTPDLDESLARLVRHPAVILILGHRGSGKTALAVRLQELLRDAAPPYAVGLPPKAGKLLPDWYGLSSDFNTIPNNAIVYVPESYRMFHARTSQTAQGRMIADLINLSRHRQAYPDFRRSERRAVGPQHHLRGGPGPGQGTGTISGRL